MKIMSATYSEIKSQYDALEKSLSYVSASLPRMKEALLAKPFKKIIFIGCGSSYTIAQSLCHIAKTHSIQADAYAAGDILLHLDRYAPCFEDSLVFAISRSGSTSEVLLLLESLTGKVAVTIWAMTAVDRSVLSDRADFSLNMPWIFDESVCQTRTVTCFYAVGAAVVALLAQDTALFSELRKVTGLGNSYLNKHEASFKQVAQMPWNNVVVLADAELEGIAGEGALAFKEICQLPSNYYHMLDSRHGPMVMIKPDTLVIVAMSDGNNALERALIQDLLKKHCYVVVYSDNEPDDKLDVTLHINFGETLTHVAKGIPFIAICQMISYYKAMENGTDPDNPDGLDAWIKL